MHDLSIQGVAATGGRTGLPGRFGAGCNCRFCEQFQGLDLRSNGLIY